MEKFYAAISDYGRLMDELFEQECMKKMILPRGAEKEKHLQSCYCYICNGEIVNTKELHKFYQKKPSKVSDFISADYVFVLANKILIVFCVNMMKITIKDCGLMIIVTTRGNIADQHIVSAINNYHLGRK